MENTLSDAGSQRLSSLRDKAKAGSEMASRSLNVLIKSAKGLYPQWIQAFFPSKKSL